MSLRQLLARSKKKNIHYVFHQILSKAILQFALNPKNVLCEIS